MTITLTTTASNVDMRRGYPMISWAVDITTATNFKHALREVRKIGTYDAYHEVWMVAQDGRVDGDQVTIGSHVQIDSLRELGATFTAPADLDD